MFAISWVFLAALVPEINIGSIAVPMLHNGNISYDNVSRSQARAISFDMHQDNMCWKGKIYSCSYSGLKYHQIEQVQLSPPPNLVSSEKNYDNGLQPNIKSYAIYL